MEFVRFSSYTYVEVEPNDNSPMMAQHVFPNAGLPFPVSHVHVYDGVPGGRLCAVTGWSSAGGGSEVRAYAVEVEDSSEGRAILVYGGDWGIRLRPAGSDAPWSLEDTNQWGETHLVLSSEEDLERA